MRSLHAFGLASVLWLTGCLGGAGDATCGVCQASFSDSDCDRIGKSQGCESGAAYLDTHCQPSTMGCQFKGCPTGKQIMCSVTEHDLKSSD